MTTLLAFAKVNLSLRVGGRDATGLHPLHSLAQSIDVADDVSVALAEEDGLVVEGDGGVQADEGNLAWRAAAAVREGVGDARPLGMRLRKRIPVAAGLGGGSADAAAGLVAAAGALGGTRSLVEELAPGLGADVSFCLTGGTLWMEGHGESLRVADIVPDYHVAVATAPFTQGTGEVFRCWDDLDGPEGPGVDGPSVPPSLRRHAPLVNDLVPAARRLRPDLADWMADVSRAWGQPVLMSGSGPTVVGFFATLVEAADAAGAVPAARFASGASPVDRGWDGSPGGTLPPPPWGVV